MTMAKVHEDFEGGLLADDGKVYFAGDELPDGAGGVDAEANGWVSPWKTAGVNGEDNGKNGAGKAPGTPDPATAGGDTTTPLTPQQVADGQTATGGADGADSGKAPAAKKTAAKKTAAKKTASSAS